MLSLAQFVNYPSVGCLMWSISVTVLRTIIPYEMNFCSVAILRVSLEVEYNSCCS